MDMTDSGFDIPEENPISDFFTSAPPAEGEPWIKFDFSTAPENVTELEWPQPKVIHGRN